MIFQTLLSAAVLACMLFSEPIVCLASTQNVAKIKDILCVLILNGVEKEDLDENTIRKLKKLHVNINDWNKEYKKNCGKNIGTAQATVNHDDLWTAFMLPQTSPTGETIETQHPNLIKLPKLEEILDSFQTTNIPNVDNIIALNEHNSVQRTTKPQKNKHDNDNIENVLNFWNQFRTKKEKHTIFTTTTATADKKHSSTLLVKNGHQIEKPNMLFEDENASRISEVNTNNDNGNEKPLLTLTTSPPNLKNHFNEYADFFDVMYKKFVGVKNDANNKHNVYSGIPMNGFGSGFQNLPPNNNPTLIEASTENDPQRFANMALPTYQTGLQSSYATSVNMPIHILQVKPIRINYMPPVTTQVTESNGSQLYSETVKKIANEVKTMLLAQLKKEIPLITLTPIRTGLTTETSKTMTTTTAASVLPITQEHARITYTPARKEPQDASSSSSETRKKLAETNGMVLKLFGLFEKLENAQHKTLSTFRPMLRPAPAQGYVAPLLRVYATTTTSAPTRDNYRSSANKNTAININNRLDPYQSPPMYNNMPYNRIPFNNMQYNNMPYSVLPPKPMSPFQRIPALMSYPLPQYNNKAPPKIYNNLNNPMENQYTNYKMIKPSMVAINAKMIQTNEFIVMPLRVPINVKGRKQDVQRLIDNQNIILNNTLKSGKPTTTTTISAPTTTVNAYDTFSKPDRNYYEWNDKKFTNAADSRESEKFIESIEHERRMKSREREKPWYGSREGRVERSRENIKAITIKHRYIPKSHYKRTSQFLAERDHEYDRRAGSQSDENPISTRYHNDYKGPEYQSESMRGNRYREKDRVDYHPHPHKITLGDVREPIRDNTHFSNRDLPREEKKFFNRDPGREDPTFFDREYSRDEHEHFNRESFRDENKHFYRESSRDEHKHIYREPPRDESKHFNREPSRDEPKHFNREPPWDQTKHSNREPLIDEPKHFRAEPLIDKPKPFNREPSRDETIFFDRDEPKSCNKEPKSVNRDHNRQPKVLNLEPPRIKYEKQKLHDPREPSPIEPNPISDSFEKLINGESVESKKDYEHRPMAPINKGPATSSSKFSDKHFKNFLSTQQKVNSMLEKILSAKTQGARLK